ncbi:MAG: inositol monophosphatase family protein [Balneolaceae bacterium]|nr:inositol monophosphatase family protein [Balneolaceae bacterium]
MSHYSKELNVAKKAAVKASEVIKSYRGNLNFDISFKGKNDLVTDADLAAEEAILEVIREVFPKDQIMAEESAEEQVFPEERTWLIDPIDGTTNFAHGFPVFCVSIAFWEQQQAKVGLVLEVNMDECFTAVKGGGAFLNEKRIEVSAIDDAKYSMIGTGFPYNDLSLVKNYLRFFEYLMHSTQGVRRPGSAAYDLCCLACGRYDGFYEYALNPWDIAAGSLIVREAGGIVTDWQGGDNWLFGERIVAGNKHIHPFLLNAIQEHFSKAEVLG